MPRPVREFKARNDGNLEAPNWNLKCGQPGGVSYKLIIENRAYRRLIELPDDLVERVDAKSRAIRTQFQSSRQRHLPDPLLRK